MRLTNSFLSSHQLPVILCLEVGMCRIFPLHVLMFIDLSIVLFIYMQSFDCFMETSQYSSVYYLSKPTFRIFPELLDTGIVNIALFAFQRLRAGTYC